MTLPNASVSPSTPARPRSRLALVSATAQVDGTLRPVDWGLPADPQDVLDTPELAANQTLPTEPESPAVEAPASPRATQWWRNVGVGLALRVTETGERTLAPVAFLLRHAVTIARSFSLLALPGLLAWACYAWIPGLSSSYPLLSWRGALYATGLYVAAGFVLVVARFLVGRTLVALRRGLNDLADYGAQHRNRT